MSRRPRPDPKYEALSRRGCVHSHAEKVLDERFHSSEFFDARDLVQVKYEMLRSVRVEGEPISHAARRFGLSRPTYYEAQAALERGGLPALVPRKPGPRRRHKLSEEVLEFLKRALADDPALRSPALAELVEQRFGISVHPRSVERALQPQEKKRH
ncbi:MAG: helix-turn-helix domain containing protein [Acidobacteriota bacterium]|nr:MAG: helix-turn-helix domain containing protein [Acidobacteriota bacterium]